MAETFLKAGGLYNIAFALLHAFSWWLFNWKEELRKLSSMNEANVQVLNYCVTFTFVIFGYISLAHTRELLGTPLGRVLLMLMTLFWFARAMGQLLLFDRDDWGSWLLFALFAIGAALYAFPALLVA